MKAQKSLLGHIVIVKKHKLCKVIVKVTSSHGESHTESLRGQTYSYEVRHSHC